MSREKFEAWMTDEQWFHGSDFEWDDSRNCYAQFGIHLSYKAWQAASKATEQQQTDSRSELTAAQELEKAREVTNCPQGVELQEHLKQLVAENVVMNSASKEVLAHWAAAEPGEMEQMMDKCMPDLRVAYYETPATDSILREAEARGVDDLAELYFTLASHEVNQSIADSWRESARLAKNHATQLREGKA